MDITTKLVTVTAVIATLSFPQAIAACELIGSNSNNNSQRLDTSSIQWDPAPEDSGQCNGKKCATGGSY
ncbi:MAG: hypothetical protein WBB82_16185 [Limnothrix sp.]